MLGVPVEPVISFVDSLPLEESPYAPNVASLKRLVDDSFSVGTNGSLSVSEFVGVVGFYGV